MFYKVIFTILAIIISTLTFSICMVKPQMHKAVFVYNSDYTISPVKEISIENKDIPVMEKPVNITNQKTVNENIETKFEPQTVEVSQKQIQLNTQKTTPTTNKIVNTPVKVQTTKATTQKINVQIQNKNVSAQKTNVEQPKIDTQKIIANNKKIIEANNNKITQQKTTITNSAPAVQNTNVSTQKANFVEQKSQQATTVSKQVQQAPVQKVLTPKEEELAWNIWRSNLTNKIMKDTNLPAIPFGTEFHFEFKVDKYGKISNLKTHTVPEKYTPYAVQYVLPVIRSYQGRSILNFPQGSQRTSTLVTGAWRISNRSLYSTPSDYNDIERIKK